MKHKLWTVFLTALVALCLVVGFAACDNGMGDGADDPIVTPTPDDEESAAHEHNYGVWQAERAATCTADGLQVRVCQTCGHEETQTLSMLGHDIVYHACGTGGNVYAGRLGSVRDLLALRLYDLCNDSRTRARYRLSRRADSNLYAGGLGSIRDLFSL